MLSSGQQKHGFLRPVFVAIRMLPALNVTVTPVHGQVMNSIEGIYTLNCMYFFLIFIFFYSRDSKRKSLSEHAECARELTELHSSPKASGVLVPTPLLEGTPPPLAVSGETEASWALGPAISPLP